MEELKYSVLYKSPLGIMEIAASDEAVISIYYRENDYSNIQVSNDILIGCISQFDEYFAGKRKEFTIQVQPEGTEFQKKVWDELLKIPYGETISYLELSRRINNEKAIRAVGRANGENPINIIIPCHRVIGSDGSLTGYGGGLWRKKWLLEHEWSVAGKERQIELF